MALLLILSLAAPASAQTEPATQAMESVTFDQAINRALEKNPTVAIAASGILRSQGLLQQVRAGGLPRLGASITNTTLDKSISFDQSVVQPRNQSVFGLQASVPVLAAAQWAASAQARDSIEVARLSSADTKRQVAVATAAAYLSVITQKRLVDIAERSLETARAQFEYNRKRREGGLGSRLNELRAGQVVSVDETLAENFRLGLRRSQEALGVLMGENGPVDTTSEPVFDIQPSEITDQWMTLRSDLRLLSGEQRAVPGHLPYARKNGVWARGREPLRQAVETAWQPWLDGKTSMDAAILDLVVKAAPPQP